jgi:hypothetical protein
MRRLPFAPEYVDRVLGGTKTTTIRKTTRLREGEVVDATVKGQPFARLELESIEAVDLELLDDHDARADGFATADALRAKLHRRYPGMRRLWRLRFHRTA